MKTTDTFSPKQRSEIMARVKSKDTAPEMTVRRLVHAMGYRYRLHRKDLPGKPDLVFARHRKVIFVHGCFWHGHDCKRGSRKPKQNAQYWAAKISRNKVRDETALSALSAQGWRSLVVWECALKDIDALSRDIEAFLSSPGKSN